MLLSLLGREQFHSPRFELPGSAGILSRNPLQRIVFAIWPEKSRVRSFGREGIDSSAGSLCRYRDGVFVPQRMQIVFNENNLLAASEDEIDCQEACRQENTHTSVGKEAP